MATTYGFERVLRPIFRFFRSSAAGTPKTNTLSPSVISSPCESIQNRTAHTATRADSNANHSSVPKLNTPNGRHATKQQKFHHEHAASVIGPLPGTTICGPSVVQTFVVRVDPGFSTYCTVVSPKERLNPVVRHISRKYTGRRQRTNSMRRNDRPNFAATQHSPGSLSSGEGYQGSSRVEATTWADIFDDKPRANGDPRIPYPTDEWDRVVVQNTLVGVSRITDTEVAIFGSCKPRRRRYSRR